MTTATARLHFEPRPWTSPCADCAAEIPLDQSVSLANEARDTVCDDCGKENDPRQFAALEVLRVVDEVWWEFAGDTPQSDPAAVASAAEFLRHVTAGIAAFADFYGTSQ